jgi:hypothetical protein
MHIILTMIPKKTINFALEQYEATQRWQHIYERIHTRQELFPYVHCTLEIFYFRLQLKSNFAVYGNV